MPSTLCPRCLTPTADQVTPVRAWCASCGLEWDIPQAAESRSRMPAIDGSPSWIAATTEGILSPADLRVPGAERYGPYQVVGVLGQGGMGIVYQARHDETGAEVAIKTVTAQRRTLLHWFRREVS